jgi:hypothetical protein
MLISKLKSRSTCVKSPFASKKTIGRSIDKASKGVLKDENICLWLSLLRLRQIFLASSSLKQTATDY